MRMALAALLLSGAGAAALAQQSGQPRQLTLKETVALAVRNSRDLALARIQSDLAQREAGLTRSEFRPNFYSGTGAAYTSGFPLAAGGGVPAVFNLTYDQQIFNPPLRGQERAAEQRTVQEQLSVDGVRDGVMVRAALAYLELAKVRHGLDLMRAERLSAQKILNATSDRVAAGRELPIEVTRAQLASARIEQRIAQYEDREDALAGELRELTGLPRDEPIGVSPEDLPAAAADNVNELVASAMTNNIELQQAESEVKASEERLKGERGGFWPTIGLTGQYNVLSRINNYDQYFNKFTRNNFIFGLEVRIPIFASRTSASIAYAQTGLNAAQLSLQKKRTDLSLEVRQQARQVHEAELAGDVARLDLQLAQENLKMLQDQFDQGRGSLKDLETAHEEENDKWLVFLDAKYARQQAELELLKTTGDVARVLQ